MSNREIATSFDQISRVYDETRDPLEPAAVDRIAQSLRKAGVRSILEIGVGTGRVARPLLDRGFEVTGADLSRGMLAHARSKGIGRLVRASGYRLPFEPRAFDATLMVHVLHMLERPAALLREARRVSRVGTFAIVNPRRDRPRRRWTDGPPRHLLRRILAQQGYPLRRWPNLPRRERGVLARHPPDRLEVVDERDVTVSVASRLDRLAKRGQRGLLHVPPKVLQRAIAEARAQAGDRTFTSHRVLSLALWRADRERRPRSGAGRRRAPTGRTGAPSRTAGRRPRGSTRPRSPSGARSARRSGPAGRSPASR
jgi:ubiquinone/menaquinone biosynthesis C-methylase UbiE